MHSGFKYIICITCAVFFCDVSTDSNYGVPLVYTSYEVINDEPGTSQMRSFIYRTAYKYLCHVKQVSNPAMILYGTKSWTFPRQSVNLTLSYPSEITKHEYELDELDLPYIITGFTVVLFADTRDSKGYISSGGVLRDTISLSFECSDVTTIRYQFWVYGVHGDASRLEELDGLPQQDYLCE